MEINNILNIIEPPNKKFNFNGYTYLPYNNTRIYENRQTYTYICNIYKKDYNKRKGLEKLCNVKYIYDIKSKTWRLKDLLVNIVKKSIIIIIKKNLISIL